MNPRQNALLELKTAAIRSLEYGDFFKMFGEGYLAGIDKIYPQKLREGLNPWSQKYWDKYISFFNNPRRSFYFRGTSGGFARAINFYVNKWARIRPQINDLLAAKSLAEQQQLYAQVHKKIWTPAMRLAMARDTTMSMLGVPKAQRLQIDKQYPGGILKFIEDSLEAVFAKLPIHDNYFWRVYINGKYTSECCPEYLREENYQLLRNGLLDRLFIHTDSVQGFLEKVDRPITRLVLLDHMDWLSDRFFPLLESEWQAIINRAGPNTRILWRSGGLRTEFLDKVQVRINGQHRELPEILKYHEQLAAELHPLDRVHTYGSFYIADLAA
jgi:S-adenosylmethionine-diacylglycerol 3-amino-3-carboxypropyl transferase